MVVGLIGSFLIRIGDADGDGEYYEEYDREGNFVQNLAVDVGNDLLDAGTAKLITAIEEIKDFISNIDWEGIGTALGRAIAYGLTALRETSMAIFEEIGPILIRTVKNAYNSISEVFLDGGVEIFAAFTTGLLFLMGMIYLIRYVYHAPLAHLGINGS